MMLVSIPNALWEVYSTFDTALGEKAGIAPAEERDMKKTINLVALVATFTIGCNQNSAVTALLGGQCIHSTDQVDKQGVIEGAIAALPGEPDITLIKRTIYPTCTDVDALVGPITLVETSTGGTCGHRIATVQITIEYAGNRFVRSAKLPLESSGRVTYTPDVSIPLTADSGPVTIVVAVDVSWNAMLGHSTLAFESVELSSQNSSTIDNYVDAIGAVVDVLDHWPCVTIACCDPLRMEIYSPEENKCVPFIRGD
jgi:hypothetical protein